MATLTTNKNYLSPVGMNFVLQRAPNTKFTCQQGNIPGLSLGVAEIGTPYTVIPLTGDRLLYNEFSITFLVNEDLDNYLEMVDWMTGIGFPESRGQYAKLDKEPPMSDSGVYSDGTLLVSNSDMNPNFEVVYRNMFPISLSDLQMDVTQSDIEYLVCTASFRYESFKINRLNLSE